GPVSKRFLSVVWSKDGCICRTAKANRAGLGRARLGGADGTVGPWGETPPYGVLAIPTSKHRCIRSGAADRVGFMHRLLVFGFGVAVIDHAAARLNI
ncbi:MAG: hypothetical protein ACI86S_002622, partial [Paracoccaceae bacterium]